MNNQINSGDADPMFMMATRHRDHFAYHVLARSTQSRCHQTELPARLDAQRLILLAANAIIVLGLGRSNLLLPAAGKD